MQESVISLS